MAVPVMAQLGSGALALALGLYVYAALAGAWAAARNAKRLQRSARNALLAALPATAAATGALVVAFVRHDFSLVYVANHSSRALPLAYRISALWGGQEGSLLLWLLILAAVAFGAVALNRELVDRTLPWAVPILAALASFFAYLLVFVSSPFDTQTAPVDGAGLNASLQNPYMLAHPPLLYLGYVGLTVPFAFAMAAFSSRRLDARWLIATRRWTIVSWTCLGLAILLGSKWAYGTIGWGGYFAWDPVENAALLPWLTATAYLHSVMVQEKKGMLRVWNVSLVVLTFSLALFGTFLTRSGLVNSIHSFSKSSIGAWFVGLIAVVVLASVALVVARLPLLRSRSQQLESLVSREAVFLYNNLLLVAFALTVLWGVLFPVISETVRGVPYSVGPPFYDFFLRAFGLPLLLLTGIGPLVAWRRASLRSLLRGLSWPAAAALAAGAALVAVGAGTRPPASRRTPSRPSCSPRSSSSSCAGRERGARSTVAPGPPRSRRSSHATGAATAAMSCTRRSRCSRSASPARASRAPPSSTACIPVRRSPSTATRCATWGRRSVPARITTSCALCSPSRTTASATGSSPRVATTTTPRRSSATRSRSRPTGCARRTCS